MPIPQGIPARRKPAPDAARRARMVAGPHAPSRRPAPARPPREAAA